MDAKKLAKYEARAKIIKALAHPARLLIVDELSMADERCVCDLTEMIGSDMSTVSKHLALLGSNGIVDSERRGHHVYYHVMAPWVTELLRARPWAQQKEE